MPISRGCRLVLFCGVGDFNDGDVVTLNVEELWERFYPQRPATRRARNSVSVLGAILPAILISVVLPALPYPATPASPS